MVNSFVDTIAVLISFVYLVNCDGIVTGDHLIRERQTGYQICVDNFDVYEDKIIRTLDSKELGAKYISERDVQTRDECSQLCCDTEKCDVFVFEEKRPGSCYLFECGPPDDFKCKFTRHRNYTSGVSKHLSELETQIKFTQHEHELSNLREPEKPKVLISNVKTTSIPPGNKETLEIVPQDLKPNEKQLEKCNRFKQFECHTSHECIAIYNACDGIEQCADGSDEAPELNCPKPGVPVTKEPSKTPIATTLPRTNSDKAIGHQEKIKLAPDTKSQPEKVPSMQQYAAHDTASLERVAESDVQQLPNVNSYQNSNPPRMTMAQNPRLAYGREGEGMAVNKNNPDNQWAYNDRSYHQNIPANNGQIFNHKGNGMIAQNERYPPPHNYVDNSQPQGNMIYNNEQPPNDYMRYNYGNYENPQYRMGLQNQYGQGNWQSMRKSNEETPMKNDRYVNGGMLPPEAYYDENTYRGRQQLDQKQQLTDNRQMMINNGDQRSGIQSIPVHTSRVQDNNPSLTYENRAHLELTNMAKFAQEEEMNNAKNPISHATSTIATTTLKPKVIKDEHHHKMSHVKYEKLTADAAFSPINIDGHSYSPSGAILSLAFGLLITALMVVLVGCRIRTVRRRLRRGGKSFAHDADFLVNGMYL